MPDRIIRESICISDTIDQLTWFEEVFWNRLIVNCDDYGRFDARPMILKNRLFPLKENLTLQTITKALDRLKETGLVMPYAFDGKPYLQISTWDKYQRVRAKRSKYPEPDFTCRHMTAEDVKCVRNPIQSESNPMRESNAEVECACDLAGGKAFAYFLDRLNANPGKLSLDELNAYVQSLGDDVCIRAMDIALGEKTTNWAFIKAILQRYTQDGVLCLADAIDSDKRRENKRERRSGDGRTEQAVTTGGNSVPTRKWGTKSVLDEYVESGGAGAKAGGETERNPREPGGV